MQKFRRLDGHKFNNTIITACIILHQLDNLAAAGGSVGQGPESETKRFAMGYHLLIRTTFLHFLGS